MPCRELATKAEFDATLAGAGDKVHAFRLAVWSALLHAEQEGDAPFSTARVRRLHSNLVRALQENRPPVPGNVGGV